MFRLGKTDVNANSKDRKGSADLDNIDGIENTEKLYLNLASRRKKSTGWSAEIPKDISPKTSSAAQQPVSGKSSNADPDLLLSDDNDDIDDYVADISDVTNSMIHPSSILQEGIQESDPRINFSSLSVVDDMDLSILTKHLHPFEDLIEDENQVWTWDDLFGKVALELRSDGRYK